PWCAWPIGCRALPALSPGGGGEAASSAASGPAAPAGRENGGTAMDTTARLARFAVETRFEDLPVAAVAHARRSILDYVGCALLGATRPGPRLLHEVIAAQGGLPTATEIGRAHV